MGIRVTKPVVILNEQYVKNTLREGAEVECTLSSGLMFKGTYEGNLTFSPDTFVNSTLLEKVYNKTITTDINNSTNLLGVTSGMTLNCTANYPIIPVDIPSPIPIEPDIPYDISPMVDSSIGSPSIMDYPLDPGMDVFSPSPETINLSNISSSGTPPGFAQEIMPYMITTYVFLSLLAIALAVGGYVAYRFYLIKKYVLGCLENKDEMDIPPSPRPAEISPPLKAPSITIPPPPSDNPPPIKTQPGAPQIPPPFSSVKPDETLSKIIQSVSLSNGLEDLAIKATQVDVGH